MLIIINTLYEVALSFRFALCFLAFRCTLYHFRKIFLSVLSHFVCTSVVSKWNQDTLERPLNLLQARVQHFLQAYLTLKGSYCILKILLSNTCYSKEEEIN